VNTGGGDLHGKHVNMGFAAKHFLVRIIATLALRRIAFDRLRIDDG
jgi:hypothetical protein